MIDKQAQDQAWRCAPKAFREGVKQIYENVEWETKFLLRDIFGTFNLTSDAEPEEMLIVPRSEVQGIYSYNCVEIHRECISSSDKDCHKAVNGVLKTLFGNKCLFDELEQQLEQTSVQVEKRKLEFKLGDKVRIIGGNMHRGEVTEIVYVDEGDDVVPYKVDLLDDEGGGKWYGEKDLEPYTEPTQTNDNMEERELDLCEILKGHEGEEFYSLMHGNIRYMTNSAEGFVMFDYPESISLYPNGKYDDNAEVILYPSRDAYLKYQLDAKKAWMEWIEEQKPKRWRAEEGEEYWLFDRTYTPYLQEEIGDIENTLHYDSGNYFRTKELAQQAAEAVKECLMKFHEQHNEQ